MVSKYEEPNTRKKPSKVECWLCGITCFFLPPLGILWSDSIEERERLAKPRYVPDWERRRREQLRQDRRAPPSTETGTARPLALPSQQAWGDVKNVDEILKQRGFKRRDLS